MPKRIWLLAALYAVSFFVLAALSLLDIVYNEMGAFTTISIYLQFLGYMTLATPLGLWAVYGKSSRIKRVAICLVPPLALTMLASAITLASLFIDGDVAEFLQELRDPNVFWEMASWAVPNAAVVFLLAAIPVAIGTLTGWFAQRCGLSLAMPGSTNHRTAVTRFSLLQLLVLMFGISAILGLQPLLATGSRIGHESDFDIEAEQVVSDMRAELDSAINNGEIVLGELKIGETITLESGTSLLIDANTDDYDFELDDDLNAVDIDEPGIAASFLSTACSGIGMGTPFVIASLISLWSMLFNDAPWRRLLWGAPLALLSGGLLLFHDTDVWTAFILMIVFLVPQLAMLWIVRSTGYRLVWNPPAEAVEPEQTWEPALLEPALA